MDQSTLEMRRRKKSAQLRRRRMTRLGMILGIFILGAVFTIRGVILPIIHLITGNRGIEVETTTQVVAADPAAAKRIPVKGAGDTAKLTGLNPGWHQSENGRWYQNADGTYFAGGFQAVDGRQYYFTEDGYLATGWITYGAREYYFDEEGNCVPDKTRPMIALTFDDGPGPYTMDLLNCLEEYGAHATFFMVGENVEYYPDEIQKMLEIGCELGNHSWDHSELTSLSSSEIENQFDLTDSALRNACGQAASVIRAPYGSFNDTVLSIGDRPFFMWCLDSLDWSYKDVQLDYDEIMNKGNLSDGTIILMHDIHEASVECAKLIIPELINRGYRLLTVSELAEAKNVTLQPATSYSDFWDSSLNNGLVEGYNGNEESPLSFINNSQPLYTPTTSSFTSSSSDYVDEDSWYEDEEEFEEEDEEDGFSDGSSKKKRSSKKTSMSDSSDDSDEDDWYDDDGSSDEYEEDYEYDDYGEDYDEDDTYYDEEDDEDYYDEYEDDTYDYDDEEWYEDEDYDDEDYEDW